MSYSTTTNSYKSVPFTNLAWEVLEQLGKDFHRAWLRAKIEHVASQARQVPSPSPSSSDSDSVVAVDFGVDRPNYEGILFDNCGYSVKEMFGEEDHRCWLNAKIAWMSQNR